MDFFFNLFGSEFMPHGHCYQWRKDILWVHVISDALITLAYACIPLALAWFVKKRTDLAFRWVFVLFAAFILLCGATHALEIWAVWHGTYRLTGLVKAMTALVSVGTAGVLVFMVPKALRLPSPQQLELANLKLQAETNVRLKTEAKLALQEKEKLFKAIVNSSPNGILLVDRNGVIHLANDAVDTMFQHKSGTLIGSPLEKLIPTESREIHLDWVEKFFEKPIERKMAQGIELYGVAQDGTRIPLEIGLNPMDWKEETYVLATLVDISERNQQKLLLEQAHQRFDRAVSGASDGLWEWNLETDQVWMSEQFFHILGYDPEKETPSFDFWSDRIHADDKEQVMATLDAHLKGGEPYITEHRLLCGDGEYRWFLSRGDSFPEPGAKGYLSGCLSGIQRRKDAERGLAEKTAFLDTIYKGTQHGIFVIDVTAENDFVFTAFNPAEERLTGINFEEIEGKRIQDLAPKYFPQEVADTIHANYQRCLDSRDIVKYTEMLPIQGRETWWITHLSPLFDESGQIYRIIGSASEISSLKRMETKLREKEEYARKILDLSLNGLYIFDLHANKNVFINPAYTQITGWSKDDLDNMDGLMSLFHPSEVEKIIAHLTEVGGLPMGESRRIEYRFRHKDGSWVDCLSNDAIFSLKDGAPAEMIGTFIDITQIKQYEKKLEDSNQELEQFAFIASHDLREPLRKIKSFGDLLVSRFAEDLPERARNYVDRMANASERLDQMINDLLLFSRMGQPQTVETVDLNKILETVIDDLHPKIKESKARVSVVKLPTLQGDNNQLYQLFLNLVGNALKYTRTDVAPVVDVSYQEEEGNHLIAIDDNGIGIPNDQVEDVFHIFKRLHGRSEYSGNGIGLAICKKIVDRHGGQIRIDTSKEKQGTRFVVSFRREE